ncbi:GNAT family N-acetyltransferase [Parahaliea mediterranea]|uniref:GNAT family N-acetyltransferase n=1 Tax=Parahaliea mediterranea TaxID=651086 RepID=A0A939DE61_9GAMM|nr:GNAT family N-acetyltransferase [Parahaliea mediterranea]MBN7796610.1 GNAT family N-acetyltransferase [Parahaliea mediterranea]
MYREARWQELQQVDWSNEQRDRFLEMQFEAQHQYYRERFPLAAFQVIEAEGVVAGRLYLDRCRDELRIVDILVAESHRNAGLGGHVLDSVLAEARSAGLPVRIYVEKSSPALRLYLRKGFFRTVDAGVYWLMECAPAAAETRRGSNS